MDLFLYALVSFSLYFFQVLYWLIIVWVIGSWLVLLRIIPPRQRIFVFVEKLLRPMCQMFSWARIGMIDLSPIILIIIAHFCINAAASFLQINVTH